MKPSSLDWNFIPISRGVSEVASPSGPSVGAKTVQGHARRELNVHELSAASALPATSVAPPAPPFTVAVKVPPSGRGDDGGSVAVRDWAAYETAAGTVAPDPSLSVRLWAVMDEAAIGSSNVTVGAVDAATSLAPSAGVWALIDGARVSAGAA